MPRWAHPLGPVLLLAVGVAAALLTSPAPVCTPRAPCGEQWIDAVGSMVFWPQLWWLFVLPEAAVLWTVLPAVFMADPGVWQGGTDVRTADAVVVAGLCWGLASALRRLSVRRAQRRRFREAAGGLTARAPVLSWAARPKRGLARCVLGVLLCAATAALVTSIVRGDRADDRAARTAPAANARVLTYRAAEGSLTVRLPDGKRHRFDVVGDYRDQRTVRVLLPAGRHVRLAAEPYEDRSDRQLLALVLGGLGLVALGSGAVAAGRAARLRRVPVPVLRVLARVRGGSAEVFAHDDTAGAHAVLHYVPRNDGRTPLHQALLFAEAAEGGEVLLASRTEHGRWRLDAGAGPIRTGAEVLPDDEYTGGEDGEDTAGEDARGGGPTLKERWDAEARVQDALTELRRTGAARPTRWRADPISRSAAVAFAVLTLAIAATAARDSVEWRVVGGFVVAPVWLAGPLATLTWRIDADPAGLRVRRYLSRRHVPWERIAGAEYAGGCLTLRLRPSEKPLREGQLVDDRESGSDLTLDRIGAAWLARRLGRGPAGERVAAEITAMVRDPLLRPQPSAAPASEPPGGIGRMGRAD
ncbi:PH domain-containing protein [Actinacidiphila yanglinensis]|uniref:PH domain-containing protein n=1 Tax=Actinacidiphila yanglinensis TaxID=310779 RepID=A0A1H6DVB4_9ACTN|nr:PH domain-containing protein [Actinacidiphila yanglinensis]